MFGEMGRRLRRVAVKCHDMVVISAALPYLPKCIDLRYETISGFWHATFEWSGYDAPPMNVLIVLGAGASRDLGSGRPMPLMPDWSNALCEALDEAERDLASACRLEPGMDGPTFETNLGLLLRWQAFRHLEERFEGLGGPAVGHVKQAIPEARRNTDLRLKTIMEVINSSLYHQFGQRRVDTKHTSAAYGQLLRELGDSSLIIATTNYDRAAESGLRQAGRKTNTGFSGMPEMTPSLSPQGMVEGRDTAIPVLHLHGAVGWYERDGVVSDHYADRPYNPTLGTPVVLYPDPEKDPTSNAHVQELWDEFERAVEVADLILVIGHSLHDPALVDALGAAGAAGTPVIVSYLDDKDESRIDELLFDALVVQMRFGPKIASSTPIASLIKKHRR